MKKLYFLVLVLALGFASCKNAPKQTATTDQEKTVDASNCEMALFNYGKLSFYDAGNQSFVLVEKETDSVVNGVFANDGKFYYCVTKDNDVYLKCLDLNDNKLEPKMLADWSLEADDCITETYGEFAELQYFPNKNMLALEHNFSWDGYGFIERKLYNIVTGEMRDWDWEVDEDLFEWYWDEEEPSEDDIEFFTEDEQYYVEQGSDIICLTDQMDVKQYASDPDYAIEIYYYPMGINPKGDMVLFAAPIEAGDFEHGPYCVASLDGKFQTVLDETDFCQNHATWLSDGSLVYQGADENAACIKIMYPNQEFDILSYAYDFVTK